MSKLLSETKVLANILMGRRMWNMPGLLYNKTSVSRFATTQFLILIAYMVYKDETYASKRMDMVWIDEWLTNEMPEGRGKPQEDFRLVIGVLFALPPFHDMPLTTFTAMLRNVKYFIRMTGPILQLHPQPGAAYILSCRQTRNTHQHAFDDVQSSSCLGQCLGGKHVPLPFTIGAQRVAECMWKVDRILNALRESNSKSGVHKFILKLIEDIVVRQGSEVYIKDILRGLSVIIHNYVLCSANPDFGRGVKMTGVQMSAEVQVLVLQFLSAAVFHQDSLPLLENPITCVAIDMYKNLLLNLVFGDEKEGNEQLGNVIFPMRSSHEMRFKPVTPSTMSNTNTLDVEVQIAPSHPLFGGVPVLPDVCIAMSTLLPLTSLADLQNKFPDVLLSTQQGYAGQRTEVSARTILMALLSHLRYRAQEEEEKHRKICTVLARAVAESDDENVLSSAAELLHELSATNADAAAFVECGKLPTGLLRYNRLPEPEPEPEPGLFTAKRKRVSGAQKANCLLVFVGMHSIHKAMYVHLDGFEYMRNEVTYDNVTKQQWSETLRRLQNTISSTFRSCTLEWSDALHVGRLLRCTFVHRKGDKVETAHWCSDESFDYVVFKPREECSETVWSQFA